MKNVVRLSGSAQERDVLHLFIDVLSMIYSSLNYHLLSPELFDFYFLARLPSVAFLSPLILVSCLSSGFVSVLFCQFAPFACSSRVFFSADFL